MNDVDFEPVIDNHERNDNGPRCCWLRHTSRPPAPSPVRPVKVFRESEAGTKRADVTAICARAPGYGEQLRNVTNLLRIVEDTFGDAVFV